LPLFFNLNNSNKNRRSIFLQNKPYRPFGKSKTIKEHQLNQADKYKEKISIDSISQNIFTMFS